MKTNTAASIEKMITISKLEKISAKYPTKELKQVGWNRVYELYCAVLWLESIENLPGVSSKCAGANKWHILIDGIDATISFTTGKEVYCRQDGIVRKADIAIIVDEYKRSDSYRHSYCIMSGILRIIKHIPMVRSCKVFHKMKTCEEMRENGKDKILIGMAECKNYLPKSVLDRRWNVIDQVIGMRVALLDQNDQQNVMTEDGVLKNIREKLNMNNEKGLPLIKIYISADVKSEDDKQPLQEYLSNNCIEVEIIERIKGVSKVGDYVNVCS